MIATVPTLGDTRRSERDNDEPTGRRRALPSAEDIERFRVLRGMGGNPFRPEARSERLGGAGGGGDSVHSERSER